ncbi:protein of unknown function [Pararobbsia alpina]
MSLPPEGRPGRALSPESRGQEHGAKRKLVSWKRGSMEI